MNQRAVDAVTIGNARVPVWPQGQAYAAYGHETIVLTRFADADLYHETLRRRVLEMAGDPARSRKYYQGACGTKVHDIEQK